jgi:hypothetical protein
MVRRTPVACDRVCRGYRYEFSSQCPFRQPGGIVSNNGLVDRSSDLVDDPSLLVEEADQGPPWGNVVQSRHLGEFNVVRLC